MFWNKLSDWAPPDINSPYFCPMTEKTEISCVAFFSAYNLEMLATILLVVWLYKVSYR